MKSYWDIWFVVIFKYFVEKPLTAVSLATFGLVQCTDYKWKITMKSNPIMFF